MAENDGSRAIPTAAQRVWAFDPGKTTGVAIWSWDGKPLEHFAIPFTDVGEYLDTIGTKNGDEYTCLAFVYEGWFTRPGQKTVGSQEEASQVIGQVKNRARQLDIPRSRIIEQSPSILPIAAKWIGFQMPKGHLPDELSAWLHGYYFLRMHKRVTSALELQYKRKSGT